MHVALNGTIGTICETNIAIANLSQSSSALDLVASPLSLAVLYLHKHM